MIEAKAMGADVILLIAACLTPGQSETTRKSAAEIELEVLLELHEEDEIDHICDEVRPWSESITVI